MSETEPISDCDVDDPKRITDAISCLDYLKRREVFLYKMMNDPSHKAMLYFLEVLMNSDAPVTLEQLAARFAHKSFSQDMKEACGGGSVDGLREFLLRYPSLFNVCANGQVSAVAIDLPGVDWSAGGGMSDLESCAMHTDTCSSIRNESTHSAGEEYVSGSLPNPIDKATGVQGKGRLRMGGRSSETVEKSKIHSSSSLSLASTPSATSSFNGKPAVSTNSEIHDHYGAKPSTFHLVRRRSNPSSFPSTQSGIYKPPHLRTQTRIGCGFCTQKTVCCNQVAANPLASVPNTTCVHCPLIDLSCHHLCRVAHHHHHATAHCFCDSAQISTSPLCHCCHPGVGHTTGIKPPGTRVCDTCPIPTLDRLMMETEAVRFFQQKLLKRDERWVQIKSLAGNLSQATPEIRAVVGPQLEFRNFLLKHPQVFEVQGELVSVRDPLRNIQLQRKPRDRFAALHTSLSTTNLSASYSGATQSSTAALRNTGVERSPRPKSLILSGTQQLLPSPFTPVGSTQNRNSSEIRRSAHFLDDSVSAQIQHYSSLCHPGRNTSAPNTPTAFNPTGYPDRKSSDKTDNTELQTISTFGDSCSTDPEGVSGICDSSSISITMSADEYRATMFIRKVLEKCGGAHFQRGLSLSELMQIISTNAQEPIQSAIGWTILELEQFILKRSIFFEMYSTAKVDEALITAGDFRASSNAAERKIVLVRNKRLKRMVNIVITGTKSSDVDGRALINKCGRIFHIAKLWGIIDLGKHEHVFFDKSIFKHVDDLQKYFKVDELLYFNAVLAPKESRAKWRATQVWKECDQEAFEKYGVKVKPSATQPLHKFDPLSVSHDWSRGSHTKRQSDPTNELQNTSSDNIDLIENDDTEAEEEIHDIAVDTTMTQGPNFEGGNYDFALHDDEEVEDDDQLVSAIARQEGLVLANDVKFIEDDSISDLNEINQNRLAAWRAQQAREPRFTSRGVDDKKTLPFGNGVVPFKSGGCERQSDYVSSSTEHTSLEVTSSGTSNAIVSCKEDASLSSSGFGGISIAVQTISTGDIMATQLYHDPAKEACPSG